MRILLILLFSFNAFASVEHEDFHFEVKLSPGGHYEVQMQMLFDQEEKFSSIITNFYLNEDLKQRVDENFISQKVSFNNTSADGRSRSYSLDMKVKKSGVTATLKNHCMIIISKKTALNSCVLKKSNAFLMGSLFKSSTNKLSCIVLENKMKSCTMTLKGQTIKIGGLFSRTADRLALSGSAEAVAKTYFLYHALKDSAVNPMTEDIYEENILRLWNEMMLELDSSDYLPRKVSVKSSKNGLIIE